MSENLLESENMRTRVLLLDESCDLRRLTNVKQVNYQVIVCLFWAAPETMQRVARLVGGKCYSLGDIIKNVDLLEKELTDFVQRLCDGGPKYKGLALRRYLSEEVFRSCLYPRICESALKFLEGVRSDLKVERLEVDLMASDQGWGIFKRLSLSNGSSRFLSLIPHAERLKVCVRKPFQMSIVKKLARQFRGARISGHWQAQIWNLIEKSDKNYAKRCFFNQLRRSGAIPSQPITFFSSYLNNSRILQPFECLMSNPVHWIVTNFYAQKPISDQAKPFSWIWEFGNLQGQDNKLKDDTIQNDCQRESERNGVSLACLPESKILQSWGNGQLTSLANLTYCWEKYLEDVNPKLVVMANRWGIEGWFTQIARNYGIPVLEVLHGVLGGYFYTSTPILSDAMVVPGEFWRSLWPEDQQRKILVFNPPKGDVKKVQKSRYSNRRRLTFFSWPLLLSTFYNFSELTGGFIQIFRNLLSKGNYEILVRCHPLENPSDFIKRWEFFYGPLPAGLQVGKHEPLDEVLAQTDVALMFRSTVMLNCLVNRIPVIMPGWIDFGWNQALVNVPGVYLAPDFPELEQRVRDWLHSPPILSEETAAHFVKPPGTGQDLFVSLVNDLMSGRERDRHLGLSN